MHNELPESSSAISSGLSNPTCPPTEQGDIEKLTVLGLLDFCGVSNMSKCGDVRTRELVSTGLA